jgi:hypothetical protein
MASNESRTNSERIANGGGVKPQFRILVGNCFETHWKYCNTLECISY